jgi:hypothetical protein
LTIDKGIYAKQEDEGKHCTTSRFLFKTVWTELQLIYWYTRGRFFCFGCSNAKKKKEKKTFMFLQMLAHHAKKIYKIA